MPQRIVLLVSPGLERERAARGRIVLIPPLRSRQLVNPMPHVTDLAVVPRVETVARRSRLFRNRCPPRSRPRPIPSSCVRGTAKLADAVLKLRLPDLSCHPPAGTVITTPLTSLKPATAECHATSGRGTLGVVSPAIGWSGEVQQALSRLAGHLPPRPGKVGVILTGHLMETSEHPPRFTDHRRPVRWKMHLPPNRIEVFPVQSLVERRASLHRPRRSVLCCDRTGSSGPPTTSA